MRAGRYSLDGLRARRYRWPLLRLVRLGCEPESVCVVCPGVSAVHPTLEDQVRFIGIDVHRDFCEIASPPNRESCLGLRPLRVIVEEAGGRLTDLDGSDRFDTGGVVATNGHMHEEVLSLLTKS